MDELRRTVDDLRRSQSLLIDTVQSQHESLQSVNQKLDLVNQKLDLILNTTATASGLQPTTALAQQTTTTVDAHPTTAASQHNTTTVAPQTDILAYDIPPSTSSYPPQPQPQIPISFPRDGTLSRSWVFNLMDTFEWGSRAISPSEFSSVFPVEELDRLVLTASEILQKEPNCVRIEDELSPVSSVVVVGDLHGQLHDLMFLLRDAGYPGDDRFFVFNGDYVDRGAWGLETFLVLLAWKVLIPDRVFLLRGNHESKYCTTVYGFKKEVLIKYGNKGKRAYKKCLSCFERLPLASIIASRVYTAHGGLFRSVPVNSKRCTRKKNQKITTITDTSLSLGSLVELSEASRYVTDPWEGQNLIPEDVLWSDPSMTPGLAHNKERGVGLLWGPDCTEEFLRSSSLKLIIRSHEGPDAREKRPDLCGMDEGYTIDHIVDSGKLITVFSAPDYPQFQATEDRYRNKGAYIVLKPPDFDTPSFEAVTPRPKVNPYYDHKNVADSDEELVFGT